MKVYISGPMTGITGNNYAAFHAAADLLVTSGHEPLNPADIPVEEGKGWADYMREDIVLLLQADGVAVLTGWELSAGARLEVDIAHRLSIPTRPLAAWVL